MSDAFPYRQIGIIGAGRVARAMALGLGVHSAAPPLIWGRDPARTGAAAAQVGRALPADAMAALAACDLIVIAISDDAIAPVAAALTPWVGESHFLFHVSGRSGAALLGPLAARGALTAAIHPAMTFTGDPPAEVARMIGARFAVTSDRAMAQARQVVALLGGVAVDIAEDQRTLYHAALCHAANHLVTLIAGAGDALAAAGVGEPYALIAPLVRAALDNSLNAGLGALSGPLLRGDADTIANHVAAIGADHAPLLPAYRAMAQATLDALERAGHAPSGAMRRALD
ncbi:Rossmann-like and DUF2520 domain-containing protein [Sphingobium sp. CAP-1]|uniref:Rossmann-like and DUF2520 domain-containing protein n=1 Tax=Sphingobium sp. CAP-1 TaxID=2676077 RepID=UPI0012BB21AA|nr:DUF2520 domain-containing protein [Sphingobium sp. CAP-1]QGP78938.1 DUF2520 domain-containing protein [Sphingobium sp. CAP-1]